MAELVRRVLARLGDRDFIAVASRESAWRGVVREAALSPGEAACNAAIASTTGVLKNVLEKKAKEPGAALRLLLGQRPHAGAAYFQKPREAA